MGDPVNSSDGPLWAEDYSEHCTHCGHWHSAGRGDFDPVCCWCDKTHPLPSDNATHASEVDRGE